MIVLAASLASMAAVMAARAVTIAWTDRPALPPPPPSSATRPVDRRFPLDPVRASLVSLAVVLAVSPAPLLAPIVVLGTWRLPSFLEARAAHRRLARADAELPQLLDLLAAASSAGLSASLALRRAAGALEGPLADELSGVVRAVDLGGRWRDELRATAERLALPDLRRMVAALTRTETLGASLAGSMNDLAERVRSTRRAALTERARTAPVKMLFPLVFLVLPAFLLLTVVPVLLTTVQSIR